MNVIDIFDEDENLPQVKTEPVVVPIVQEPQHKISDDFEKLTRDVDKSSKVLDDLITIGMRDIKNLSSLAEESENPRAYEIVSTMINSIKDTAMSSIDLHHKKAVIKNLIENGVVGKNTSSTSIQNVQNAVFVGTVADAIAQIREQSEGQKQLTSMDLIELEPKPHQDTDVIDVEEIIDVDEEQEEIQRNEN